MLSLKTILNYVEKHKGFCYQDVRWGVFREQRCIEIMIAPRAHSRAVCSQCEQPASGYDIAAKPRTFQYIPLWNIPVILLYCMLSRIGLNTASQDRVKTSQCSFSFRTRFAFATQVNSWCLTHPIREERRPGSLGSEAGREWALRKLVGAWPPQAERARPVERDSHARYMTEIYSSLLSLPLSLGLSAAWLALSFNR